MVPLVWGDSWNGKDILGFGTIFSFNPANNALTSLASFDGTNGIRPTGKLILGADGLFYGTTNLGGDFGDGTIFSFNHTNNTLTSLVSFDTPNFGGPATTLTLGADGLFYGATYETLFSFNPANNALTTNVAGYDFNGFNGYSFNDLILGADGLFYGTTLFGGDFDDGTIFSFDPANNPVQPIPEPLTLLGASAAVAFGAAFKRRKNQG